MFSASQLTSEQKEQIEAWAAEGAQLQDIQKRMQEDLEIQVTYMDTRFLVLDLGIELKSEETAADAPKPEDPIKVPTGEVEASVDEIVRPGALKSGSVSFSDGEKALWMIDEMGRLSLDADTPGYQPEEEDLIKFQEKLRDLLT
ncbi:hypothetical protein ACFPK9_10255 [Rubritalea spongiae]|uniref:Uncharacterized protein n=1 Tax=Rubritalea spongiae TaxID=430797 RepID=A0ABW5DZZ0_9BACT